MKKLFLLVLFFCNSISLFALEHVSYESVKDACYRANRYRINGAVDWDNFKRRFHYSFVDFVKGKEKINTAADRVRMRWHLECRELREFIDTFSRVRRYSKPFFIGRKFEKTEECQICMDKNQRWSVVLMCGHELCKTCLLKNFCTSTKNNDKCPFCRDFLDRGLLRWLTQDRRYNALMRGKRKYDRIRQRSQLRRDAVEARRQQNREYQSCAERMATEG